MLNHGISDQRPHHVIFCGYKTRSARFVAIDSHVGLRFQCVDVVYGVLLTCRNVYTTSIISSKAGLLRTALSRILHCGENFGVCVVCFHEGLLGYKVETTRGEDTPVKVPRC
jgi:hypothetical protein